MLEKQEEKGEKMKPGGFELAVFFIYRWWRPKPGELSFSNQGGRQRLARTRQTPTPGLPERWREEGWEE